MARGNDGSVDSYFQSDAADDLEHAQEDGEQGDTDQDDGYDRPHADVAAIKADLAPIPGGGPLLEEPSARKLFVRIDKGVMRQETLAKNREESRKHLQYLLDGNQFSILEKSEDQSVYKQLFPLGSDGPAQPIPNKVEDLAGKIVSQLLVDKFLPDPKPDGADSDKNRAAADLVKKLLRKNASPTELDEQAMLIEALSENMIGQSAFVWVWVDKTGGGWRPMQKLSHPHATDANNPLVGPKLGPDGQPIQFTDQTTGETTVITEHAAEPVLRYVAESRDGNATEAEGDVEASDDSTEGANGAAPARYEFTQDPAAAARQWMPKMKRSVLRLSQVRTHPPTATAAKARAITLLCWEPLVDAKARFAILDTLTTAQLKDACSWRPKRWKTIVPDAVRPRGQEIGMEDGQVSDDTLFFWYHHYCRPSTVYQDGAEIAVNGGAQGSSNGLILCRDTLRVDVELDDGTTVPVLMDPPVAQFKATNDARRGDMAGIAPLSRFAGANEIYAQLYVSILDVVFKGLNPNTYIPSTSPVTREDINRRDGTPIMLLVPEDKPFVETAPQIPTFTPDILKMVGEDMNSAAGTNETSNGLDSKYAASGVAKDISIRQAKVALAEYWQNTASGLMQFWAICKQLAQARYTVPMEVMLAGTESAFKQKYFVGADLIGVTMIPPASGSGTMMAPMEKLQLLSAMVNGKFLDEEEAGERARASMSDDLGLAPNPHEEHADRRIGAWLKGPPTGWLDDYTANEHAKAQYTQAVHAATSQMVAVLTSQGLDPQTAQQQATQAVQQHISQPQLKPLMEPFEQRPNDAEPGVAKINSAKLSRLQSTLDYSEADPRWRTCVDRFYAIAFYNAGGQTVAQQAQAAQGAAAAGQKGEMDATWQQFYQDIRNKVMAAESKAIAKSVAGELGAGTPAGAASAADAQATAQPDAAAAQEKAQSADHSHSAAESAAQRAHQSSESAADRTAKLHSDIFKGTLDSHTKMGLAQLAARQRAAGASAAPGQAPTPAAPAAPSLAPQLS